MSCDQAAPGSDPGAPGNVRRVKNSYKIWGISKAKLEAPGRDIPIPQCHQEPGNSSSEGAEDPQSPGGGLQLVQDFLPCQAVVKSQEKQQEPGVGSQGLE